MTFLAEDGTGLASANSLCSLAYAKSYFADRGVLTWDVADTDAQRVALIKATDYVETRWSDKFRGCVQFPGVQALSFPRLGIDADSVVPVGVLKAVCEYALRALAAPLAPDPTADASGRAVNATTKRVGPIETIVQYQPGSTPATYRPYPMADALLRPYLYAVSGTLVR